jgi:DNA polymerase/3'-5' exonuclease PolX
MDSKSAILSALETMQKKEIADKQPFKARAYAKVIAQIKTLPSVCAMDDLASVTGIGDKIRAKILEILSTGSLQAAERAKVTHNLEAHEALQNVYGIGPSKSNELVAAGITSIAALRAASLADPKLLTDNQKVGLRHYEDLLERIPRSEMDQHAAAIRTFMPEEFQHEIVGSYRRGAINSGDIDVLVRVPYTMSADESHSLFRGFIRTLAEEGYITDVLAQGDKKCMAVCKVGGGGKYRRLDVLLTPAEEYAYAILYFTGSDKFNVAFRKHADTCGYTLNEHRMAPERAGVQKVPPMGTEADIFGFLGLRYVPPENRVDGYQIIPF